MVYFTSKPPGGVPSTATQSGVRTWLRNPFVRSSSSQSLLPLTLAMTTPGTNTSSEQIQNPFWTPFSSQPPSASASTDDLQSLPQVPQASYSSASTNTYRITPDTRAVTANSGHAFPAIALSLADSPLSSSKTFSSGSSKASRYVQSNERSTAQFPESQGPSRPRPERPSLPPSPPIETPPAKWTRGPGFWSSFTAICIPLLLSALEGSVTNTALPTISEALDLGTMFSWVATAFLLASTIFQPLYGQLANIWGRKYPMIFSVAIFGAGSAICGFASNGGILIFGRIVQGLGTGGIDLFAEMIIADMVPLRQRGTYTSIKHGVFAIGTTIGPLLGGVFAERDWRWCFWINLPVCFASIVMLWFWLRVGGGVKATEVNVLQEFRKVDGWGAFLLTSSVVLVLVALSTGGALHPWDHFAIVIPLLTGIIGLCLFPIWECSGFCSSPIMPPHIFSNRTSATAFTLTALHGFLTYGVQFFLPPFFQAVKGSSPTESGIEVLPTTLLIVVMAAVGGPLLSRWGKYRPIHQVGFACLTLGFGLCVMLKESTPTGAWVSFQLLVAFGSGIIVSTMFPAVLVELPDEATGVAAGSWAFLRGTGSLFGVAIPSMVFNLRFGQLLPSIASPIARAQLANGQAYQHASTAFVSKFGPVVKAQIIKAFTKSLMCVWVTFAIVAGVGFLLTFMERQVKMRRELDTKYGLKARKSSKSAMTTPESGPSREDITTDAEKAPGTGAQV